MPVYTALNSTAWVTSADVAAADADVTAIVAAGAPHTASVEQSTATAHSETIILCASFMKAPPTYNV